MTGEATASAPGSIRDRAVDGVFWSTAQRWMVRGSTLVAFVLLGRLLTPHEFGVVALAMTVITLLGAVSDAGFTPWLIQRRALTPAATSTAFWISSGLGVALAVALAAMSVPVADLLGSAELATILPVLAATLVVTGVSGVPAALLQRDMRFKELAVRQVLATGLSVVAAIGLALAGAGVWALVAQTVVRVVVAAVLLFWTTRFRPAPVFSRTEAAEMLGYGSRSLGVTLGSVTRSQAESLVVGVVLGTVALGYWAVAGRIASVLVELCSSAVGSVAVPVFAQLQDQPDRLARVYGRVLAAASLVLVPAMAAMALASFDLIPFVFGGQWEPSAGVAALLAGGTLFLGLLALQRGVLLSTGRAGTELWLTSSSVLGQIVLVLVLGATSGLPAVAAGVSVWWALVFVVRAVTVARVLGIGLAAYRQTMALFLSAGVASAAVLAVVVPADLVGLARVAVVLLLGGAVFAAGALLLARPTVADVLSAVSDMRLRRRGAASTPRAVSATGATGA